MPEPRPGVVAAARVAKDAARGGDLGWSLLEASLRLSDAEACALQWLSGPQEQTCLFQWLDGGFDLAEAWGASPEAAPDAGWMRAQMGLQDSRHVLAAWQRAAGACSSAPVGEGDHVFAVLHLFRRGAGPALPHGAEGPLHDLTRLAAMQIEAGLNRERLDRENRALRALAGVATTLLPQHGEEAIAERVLLLAMGLGGFSRGALLLRQPGAGLGLCVSVGLEALEQAALRACPLDPHRSPQLAALAQSASLSPEQLQAHPGLGPCFPPTLKRFRSLPLADGQGLMGLLVLAAGEPAGSFEEGLFNSVGPVLASQAARSVETSRLVSQLADSKRRLEETTDSLLQAERLAAIGRLAAGVAHQIRNPLTIISATTELMIERLGAGHALLPDLERLAGKVSDTEAIVRDLMQLGKPLQVKLQKAAVLERLRNVAQYIRGKAEGQGVRLLLSPLPGAETAWMDPALLERCLLELSMHGLQGMEHGGMLELGCGPGPGGSALVWIQDDGRGLADVAPDQIFEPFVSRRLGGTGLTLYNVQRVCQAMGASIVGGHRPGGKGALFSIHLPSGETAPMPILGR